MPLPRWRGIPPKRPSLGARACALAMVACAAAHGCGPDPGRGGWEGLEAGKPATAAAAARVVRLSQRALSCMSLILGLAAFLVAAPTLLHGERPEVPTCAERALQDSARGACIYFVIRSHGPGNSAGEQCTLCQGHGRQHNCRLAAGAPVLSSTCPLHGCRGPCAMQPPMQGVDSSGPSRCCAQEASRSTRHLRGGADPAGLRRCASPGRQLAGLSEWPLLQNNLFAMQQKETDVLLCPVQCWHAHTHGEKPACPAAMPCLCSLAAGFRLSTWLLPEEPVLHSAPLSPLSRV